MALKYFYYSCSLLGYKRLITTITTCKDEINVARGLKLRDLIFDFPFTFEFENFFALIM